MATGKVQERGQVTVPREIREACGIEAGTELYFVPTSGDAFECRVFPAQRSLREALDLYTVDDEGPDVDGLRRQMGEDIAHEIDLAGISNDRGR